MSTKTRTIGLKIVKAFGIGLFILGVLALAFLLVVTFDANATLGQISGALAIVFAMIIGGLLMFYLPGRQQRKRRQQQEQGWGSE